jgi:hypothetical protein
MRGGAAADVKRAGRMVAINVILDAADPGAGRWPEAYEQ